MLNNDIDKIKSQNKLELDKLPKCIIKYLRSLLFGLLLGGFLDRDII